MGTAGLFPLCQSQSHFTADSQSVSQSVSQYVLVSSTLVGLATRYYFLSECCCLKFAVLYLWGALSDERTGLQFAVQSLNGPSHSEPVTMLYCLIWDSPTWRARSPYLYPAGTGWPSYTPGHWVPLTLSPTTRRAKVEVFYPSPNVEGQVPVYTFFRNRIVQSKVKVTLLRTVSQYVLVPSPLGTKGVPSEGISIRHLEGYIKAKFLMLAFRGLHEKHAVQRGIWVPTQHSFWDQEEPRKTLIELAGRRTFRMQTGF
jgi:hypothetical protein